MRNKLYLLVYTLFKAYLCIFPHSNACFNKRGIAKNKWDLGLNHRHNRHRHDTKIYDF